MNAPAPAPTAASKAGAAPSASVITAEALAELQQKMFALNAAGKVREAGAVRKEFKKLEAQFKAQPPPPPPLSAPSPALSSAAATTVPTAAVPAAAAPAAAATNTSSSSLPTSPADEMYVAPPAASVIASATTATTTTATANSNSHEVNKNTQGSTEPGALSSDVAQEVERLKSMAQAQWRAGDKEAGRALLRQAKALETSSSAATLLPSSSPNSSDAPGSMAVGPATNTEAKAAGAAGAAAQAQEAENLRMQAIAAKDEAVALHKAGKKEEARAALLRAKSLEARASAAAATAGATSTTGADAGSSHLTAPSQSSQPSTAAAGGQHEARDAGWNALESALSDLIAERSSRNAADSGGGGGGGGSGNGTANGSNGGGGSGEEWASASEEVVGLQALQAEVSARRRSSNAQGGGEPAPQFTLGRGVVGAPRAVVVPSLKSDELQVELIKECLVCVSPTHM